MEVPSSVTASVRPKSPAALQLVQVLMYLEHREEGIHPKSSPHGSPSPSPPDMWYLPDRRYVLPPPCPLPTSRGQRRRGGWARGRGACFSACSCVHARPEEKAAQLLGSGLVPCLVQMPQTGRRIPEGCPVGGQWVGGLCYQKLGLFPMGPSPPSFQAQSECPQIAHSLGPLPSDQQPLLQP